MKKYTLKYVSEDIPKEIEEKLNKEVAKRCDSIINDALLYTADIFDKLREASKYDLPIVSMTYPKVRRY